MNKIIKKALNGDKQAFVTLIESVQAYLYVTARSKLENEEDVKDAIQETIAKAYENITSLKDPKKFRAWINTILVNECNKYYLDRNNTSNISIEENEIEAEDEEDMYLELEDKIVFTEIIRILEDDEREIVLLFYSANKKIKTIAKELNLNENTVKTRLRRARNRLSDYIERMKKNDK